VGLKMRTVPADLQQLPAPTQIPWPELFTFRRTGVVEGTANRKANFMLMRLADAGIK
jgi:TRAP-type C4-dicarboxylate transport system substrate-binding protein